jgi:hypothetical protein
MRRKLVGCNSVIIIHSFLLKTARRLLKTNFGARFVFIINCRSALTPHRPRSIIGCHLVAQLVLDMSVRRAKGCLLARPVQIPSSTSNMLISWICDSTLRILPMPGSLDLEPSWPVPSQEYEYGLEW